MGGGMGGGGIASMPDRSPLGDLAQRANPQAKDPMQNLGNRGFPNIPKETQSMILGAMSRGGQTMSGKTAMNPDQGTTRPGGEPSMGGGRVTAAPGGQSPMGGTGMDRVPRGEARPSPRPTIRPTALPEGGQQQKFQFQQLGYNRPTPRPGSAQPILGAGPGGIGGGAKPPAQPGGGPPRFSDFWNQDSWNQNQGTNFKPGEDRQGARRLARQEAIDSWQSAGGSGQLYPGSPPGGPSARKEPMVKPGRPLESPASGSFNSGAGK